MKRTFALVLAVALIATLAGCSSDQGKSLADSKSPAQFLRTEAINRLPGHLFEQPDSTSDVSVPCKKAKDDPNELYREWKSTAEIQLYKEAAKKVDRVVDNLVETFLKQGWSDRSLGGAGVEHSRFIWSDKSLALLRVTGKYEGVDPLAVSVNDDAIATLTIETRGPCVLTGGADSEEVKKLEGRA